MSILESVQKAFDFQTAKKNLQDRLERSLTLAYAGGLFSVSPELIVFAAQWQEPFVVKDSLDNPIKIDDPADFVTNLKLNYQQATNEWLNEFERAKKIRKNTQI